MNHLCIPWSAPDSPGRHADRIQVEVSVLVRVVWIVIAVVVGELESQRMGSFPIRVGHLDHQRSRDTQMMVVVVVVETHLTHVLRIYVDISLLKLSMSAFFLGL